MTVFVTPEPEATHYGIGVTCIGEDGDMLALGHHPARMVLAAFNCHARTEMGLANLADCRSITAAEVYGQITPGWGQFRRPDPAQDEDPDWEWVLDQCGPDAEHATPYTRYRNA